MGSLGGGVSCEIVGGVGFKPVKSPITTLILMVEDGKEQVATWFPGEPTPLPSVKNEASLLGVVSMAEDAIRFGVRVGEDDGAGVMRSRVRRRRHEVVAKRESGIEVLTMSSAGADEAGLVPRGRRLYCGREGGLLVPAAPLLRAGIRGASCRLRRTRVGGFVLPISPHPNKTGARDKGSNAVRLLVRRHHMDHVSGNEQMVSLFALIEEECNSFLNTVDEKVAPHLAAEKFLSIINHVSKLVENGAPQGEGFDAMLEIANAVVQQHGVAACARVGVNRSKDLMLIITPVGCEAQHFIEGVSARPIGLPELRSMGFTPHTMALSLSKFAYEIVVFSMVTMPGGIA
jgi:hypothetical protein